MKPRVSLAAIATWLALVVVPAACVNRGMHAPVGDGGSGAGGARDGGLDALRDSVADMGGVAGAGGGGGTIVVPCNLDASADASGCTALLNFENCNVYMATLNVPTQQLAFTDRSAVSSPTFCGNGALQLSASFEADGGLPGKGEVYLTIPGGPIDLSGKMLTVHVLAVPAMPATALLYVFAVGDRYSGEYVKINGPTSAWTSGSVVFPAVDAGVSMTERFAVQVLTRDKYNGALYLDEIDVTNPPPDGGASDGGAAPDARDASGG